MWADYDKAKKLNVDKIVLEYLRNAGYTKLNVWVLHDWTLLNGLNFYLQVAAETKQNWAISKKINNKKKDNIQWCSKKIMIEAKWDTTNDRKVRINAKEGDAVCVW